MAKLKLPFELEKPDSNSFVTQASEIGYRNSSLTEELDGISDNIEGVKKKISDSEEDWFYLVDSEGNIALKFDKKGFDAAFINPRLKKEEFSQSFTEEDGFYIVDSEGNIAFKVGSSGADFTPSAALISKIKAKIPSSGGGGGTSYDSVGYPILTDNPLAMLVQGASRARLFRTWGIIGASFETDLVECLNDGTATNMYDNGVSWVSLFASANGVEADNYAIAGSTLKNWLSSSKGWAKLDADDAKQAYIVNMSSNDNDKNKYTEEIGDVATDIDYADFQNNANTFVGLLATIIQKLRIKSPRCYIFLATRRNAHGAKSNTRTNAMCQAIRNVCPCFPNVYLIDMWEYGIDWDDADVMKEFKCGGHPNRNGHIYLADAFNTYIDWVIRNNPIGMRDSQFVGTNYQDKDNY